jgi:hypothetical protein
MANVRGVNALSVILTLPMTVAASLGAHVIASRGVKAVLWSTSPLSTGEPQAFTYERNVYRTAEAQVTQVVAAVLGAGVLLWLGGVRGAGWITVFGVLVWLGGFGLDLARWQRVAVSASNLWFQRGLGQTVHQIAVENIRDVAIEERDVRGLTLRHGRNNRVCRLNVRMKDKRIVALPKTDAHTGLGDVEEVANQLRTRLRQLEDRESLQRSQTKGEAAAKEVAGRTPAEEDEMRRALRRLRRGATAPDVPKAVKLPNGS